VSYRLPTVKELKALRKIAGSEENNLSYWATYTPTPEAVALQESQTTH